MRKLKFLFATLIALALIVTGVAVAVSADDTVKEVGTLEDLQAAIGAGESVKLTADIDAALASAITVKHSLTIDLNGYSIRSTGTSSVFYVRNDQHETNSIVVTIKNSNSAKASTISSNGNCLCLRGAETADKGLLVIDGGVGGIVLERPSTHSASKYAIALELPTADSISHIKITGKVDWKLDKALGSSAPFIAGAASSGRIIIEFDKANFNVPKTDAIKTYSGPGTGRDNYTPIYFIAANTDFIINESTLNLYYAPLFKYSSNTRDVTLTTNNSSIKNYGEAVTESTVANDSQMKLALFQYTTSTVGGTLKIDCNDTKFNMGYTLTTMSSKVTYDFKFTDCDFILLDASEGGAATGTFSNCYPQLFGNPQKCIIEGGTIDGYVRISSNSAANLWNDDGTETGILLTGDVKLSSASYPLNTWSKWTTDGEWYYTGTIDPMTHKASEPAYTLYQSAPVDSQKVMFNLFMDGNTADTLNFNEKAFDEVPVGAYEIVDVDGDSYFRYHYNNGGAYPASATVASYLGKYYNSTYTSNVKDGMLTGDFDYWTFDYDISSSGNGFAPHILSPIVKGSAYTETVDVATGVSTRTFKSNPASNYGLGSVQLAEDGTIAVQYRNDNGSWVLYSETTKLDTAEGVWSHVTVVLSVKDNATYVFVNGVKEIEVKHSETYPVLGIQSATDWTDAGETKSRVVTTTTLEQFKFERFAMPKNENGVVTDARDVYFDNFVMQGYRGNYDIGNALEGDSLFDSVDALYAPTYQMPAGQTPVANLNGIDFYGVNNLQAYLEREQAKDPENTGMFDDAEIELLAPVNGFVVDYAFYVITNGNEFTYFSDKYFGEVDGEDVYFVEAEPEQFATVEWKSGDAVVKSGEYIIGTTIPAGVVTSDDANGYFDLNYVYEAYTVAEEGNVIECENAYAANLQNVKYNVSTQSFFFFHVYVPVPAEELNVVITNNSSDNPIVNIGGVPHYQIKFHTPVYANRTSTLACNVTYTVNGVELSQTFSFKLADYFKQVLADEKQSDEAVALIVSAVNYCNEMTKLANDGQGNAEYEAILAEKASVIPALDEKVLAEQQAAIKAPDASFTEYFEGATIYYADSNPRWALVANEGVEIDPALLTFSNALGTPTAVEDTQLLVANYAFTPKVWDIDDTVTITYTVDENTAVSCEYNLASYILGVEGQGGNADFARALYQFCLASEAYTGNGN